MFTQPTLSTTRLVLRPFLMGDAATVQRLAGVHEIAFTTLHVPHPYKDGMAEAWIRTHAAAWGRNELAAFAITEPAVGLIGAITLRIESAHRRAELGYWVGAPYWGQGYATEAALVTVRFGFDKLDLHRIYASHLTRNPASGRVMVKVGMEYEGCLRQHILKWGIYEDVSRYGILRTVS
ncbi:MAG TPA: GNAT family N-acetyltransferase [Burkholderiales bacterium]|nr:GNAT family N-acetyltransferase [Burkholderiales bacterium]